MKQILAVLLTIALASCTTAQDTEFEKDTRILLDLTGSGEIGVQTMEQMINYFKQSYTDVPSEFWDEFKKEFNADELVDLVAPIYMKHYSHEDVKGLIEFYNTPLGQKTVAALPSITTESMIAGQKWGEKLGARVIESLRKKGYIDD